jgi:hypothetical protein
MERLTQGKKLEILLENGSLSIVDKDESGVTYEFEPLFGGKNIQRKCSNPFIFINDILKFKRLI